MVRDPLSLAFGALADPTRRAILSRLAKREATVGELAEPFDMTMPAISNHLKVLERAGLIVRKVDAQRRRCSLTPKGLTQARAYMSEVASFWDESFGNLDVLLAKQEAAPADPGNATDGEKTDGAGSRTTGK